MCLIYFMCMCMCMCLVSHVDCHNLRMANTRSNTKTPPTTQESSVPTITLPPLAPAKLRGTQKEKVTTPTIDSRMLSNMATNYYNYFATYSKKRKQITQLVPNMMWTLVYADFKAGKP